MRVWIDKIASATRNVALKRDAWLNERITAREGMVIAGRIHGEKTTYNVLEDVHGRQAPLHDGDVIAGVLGPRQALQGYAGFVPESISVGDRLQLLNMGGVIGKCSSQNPDLGKPFDVEVLGSVLVFPEFGNRSGVPADITMNAITSDSQNGATPKPPVIFVAGTCMNSGKTFAACHLVRQLSKRGEVVGGCKLTGVSLRRDALQMMDYGAKWALTFNDAGIVTTGPKNAPGVAQTILTRLGELGAGVVVAELGDGIMGEYGVAEILRAQKEFGRPTALVMCANDPVGAWGAKQIMDTEFGIPIDVVAGPATDNAVGVRFIENTLGLRAINARTHGPELGAFIAERAVEARKAAAR
ncbi:MAG: hypothetical protein KDA32_08855 [Phycisphaerales bacterium]|nr:hypothetical protein [Phycisphaerales bacterium]